MTCCGKLTSGVKTVLLKERISITRQNTKKKGQWAATKYHKEPMKTIITYLQSHWHKFYNYLGERIPRLFPTNHDVKKSKTDAISQHNLLCVQNSLGFIFCETIRVELGWGSVLTLSLPSLLVWQTSCFSRQCSGRSGTHLPRPVYRGSKRSSPAICGFLVRCTTAWTDRKRGHATDDRSWLERRCKGKGAIKKRGWCSFCLQTAQKWMMHYREKCYQCGC